MPEVQVIDQQHAAHTQPLQGAAHSDAPHAIGPPSARDDKPAHALRDTLAHASKAAARTGSAMQAAPALAVGLGGVPIGVLLLLCTGAGVGVFSLFSNAASKGEPLGLVLAIGIVTYSLLACLALATWSENSKRDKAAKAAEADHAKSATETRTLRKAIERLGDQLKVLADQVELSKVARNATVGPNDNATWKLAPRDTLLAVAGRLVNDVIARIDSLGTLRIYPVWQRIFDNWFPRFAIGTAASSITQILFVTADDLRRGVVAPSIALQLCLLRAVRLLSRKLNVEIDLSIISFFIVEAKEPPLSFFIATSPETGAKRFVTYVDNQAVFSAAWLEAAVTTVWNNDQAASAIIADHEKYAQSLMNHARAYSYADLEREWGHLVDEVDIDQKSLTAILHAYFLTHRRTDELIGLENL